MVILIGIPLTHRVKEIKGIDSRIDIIPPLHAKRKEDLTLMKEGATSNPIQEWKNESNMIMIEIINMEKNLHQRQEEVTGKKIGGVLYHLLLEAGRPGNR